MAMNYGTYKEETKNAKKAEGYIYGALRGGFLKGNYFYFCGRGFMKIEASLVKELRLV